MFLYCTYYAKTFFDTTTQLFVLDLIKKVGKAGKLVGNV